MSSATILRRAGAPGTPIKHPRRRNTIVEVLTLLGDALQLGKRVNSLDASTQLLGSLPELDSMAVVTVISANEEHFGVTVHDDEISAETFATLGSLASFVEQKIA